MLHYSEVESVIPQHSAEISTGVSMLGAVARRQMKPHLWIKLGAFRVVTRLWSRGETGVDLRGTPDDSVKRAFHHTTHFTEGISVMKCAAQCQE